MAKSCVMITGGDGYLGLQVATRYLERTDEPVLLWVHAKEQPYFQAKQQRVASQLNRFADRLTFGGGDLVDEQPFQGVKPERVKLIIHSAAVTRFNVDADTAQQVNVEGATKLMEFASRCPSLQAIGLMSTVYTSGLRAGPIREVAFDDSGGFANHYERSKWQAETMLMSQFAELPWRVLRVATAIADDESGKVTQQNAFHNTLKLFFYGLLSLIPGKPQTPLYFVTGRFAADAVFELMQQPASQMIYHIAHTRQESASLGELIDSAFEVFLQEEDFKQRRLLKPLYTDAEAFDLLVQGVNSFGGGVVNQAVSSVAPFARQLFIDKAIENQHLVERLSAYRAPDPRQLVRSACEYLIQTRWGRTR